MTPFPLKIVTPDGIIFEGLSESVTVRSITGDLGILAGHTNLVAPLGIGRCAVVTEGKRQCATCSDGVLSVLDGAATLLCANFEWTEESGSSHIDTAKE